MLSLLKENYSMKLVIVFCSIFLVFGCVNEHKKQIENVYCWTSSEISFYIDQQKESKKEIDFDEMKDVFLEDKNHIQIIGVNNEIDKLEFFVINIDLIFHYRNNELVLLKDSEKVICY